MILPVRNCLFSPFKIVFELVPKPDGSCSGFTESMIPLLTLSNEKLLKSILWHLSRVMSFASLSDRLVFLESGFFAFLPQAFYLQEMHLFAQPKLCLMKIVANFIPSPGLFAVQDISETIKLSMNSFNKTFSDKFFHPIEPFRKFVCVNRRRIRDSMLDWDFPRLLRTIVCSPPFVEEMTQFVLSSPFAVTYTDCHQFFENDSSLSLLLGGVVRDDHVWQKEHPAVLKRAQQILNKLDEEGLSDAIGLHSRCTDNGDTDYRAELVGVKQFDQFGGNAPFKLERWNWNDHNAFPLPNLAGVGRVAFLV
ncbi:hypothetical protein BLNAU_19497 [Blattamonas nauphoetae]|uniref:Uncharacterized protein n=1 Tax=Blattamonas nauphoetae TaxID=2049346 RepID=A0ABQ9X1E0_9EUKA|nr:hypothetical protein BLNAU_19497 [Blattamonas nauphoetae]